MKLIKRFFKWNQKSVDLAKEIADSLESIFKINTTDIRIKELAFENQITNFKRLEGIAMFFVISIIYTLAGYINLAFIREICSASTFCQIVFILAIVIGDLIAWIMLGYQLKAYCTIEHIIKKYKVL